MRTDLLYSMRVLRKDPTFTVVVAFTLAMCIGASTALFTIVRNVLLRPLAIPDSNRVLLVYNSYPKAGIEYVGSAASDYADRLQGVAAFEEQALLDFQNPSLDIASNCLERSLFICASTHTAARDRHLTNYCRAPLEPTDRTRPSERDHRD